MTEEHGLWKCLYIISLSYPFLAISLLGKAIESRIISEAAWLSGYNAGIVILED